MAAPSAISAYYDQYARHRVDRSRFVRSGRAAGFQFIQDPRDYGTRSAHTNQDTYERLSENDLKQAAVAMAIFVYNTAQRDAMLPREPMPHSEVDEQRGKAWEGIYPAQK